MSSTSHSEENGRRIRFPAAWLTVAIFVTIEIVVRLLPMQYGMGAGVFLTTHRRELADAGAPEYDYIILGESRSLSVAGYPADPVRSGVDGLDFSGRKFSVYNFSLPAMGSRYFSFFFEKYMQHRETAPAAVILAADPGVFQEHWNLPLHDPMKTYTDERGESVATYAYHRSVRRVLQAFGASDTVAEGSEFTPPREAFWDSYSHRFLHMFSPAELARQFDGAERLFVLREAVPLQYYTYRYRQSIRHGFTGLFRGYYGDVEIPEHCRRCDMIDRPECRPNLSDIQDNQLIEEHLAATNGGINLGDRLNAVERLQYGMVRDQLVAQTHVMFEATEPDLRPLEALLKVTAEHGSRLVLAPTPTVEQYRDTRYYRLYREQVQELLQRYPHATMLSYPRPYFPAERFVDQIHYDCPTSRSVNADFYRDVMPRILEFAPPRAANDGER